MVGVSTDHVFYFTYFRLVRHQPIESFLLLYLPVFIIYFIILKFWFVKTRTMAILCGHAPHYLPVLIIIEDEIKPAEDAVSLIVPVFSVDCNMAKHNP